MRKKVLLPVMGLALAATVLCLFFARPANLSSFHFLSFSTNIDDADASAALSALTNRYFQEKASSSTLNLHYTLADPESYGIARQPVHLGMISADLPEEERIRTENTLAALHGIDRSALTEPEKLTWDVLEDALQEEMESYDWYFYEEPLSPTLGVQAQLPILLAEYAFYTEQDVTDYLELLSQVGDYFDSLVAFEQEKAARGLFLSDAVADAVIDQCIDFIEGRQDSYLQVLFEEKLAALSDVPEARKQLYLAQHTRLLEHTVFPAYEQLVNSLCALKGSGVNDKGLCYFPEGSDYYRYLVQAVTGSEKSPAQLQALLDEKRQDYTTEIQSLAAAHPALLASLDLSLDTGTPEHTLETLQQAISRDFPTLSNISYTVRDVPASLQATSSPAFYLTPPIDRLTDNVIYINPRENYEGLDLFTVLAHEGYPGHLYQTVYSSTHCANPLQGILSYGGYTEGWATYAELYSYGICRMEEPAARLLMLNKAWALNLYSTIDLGIHYYGWSEYDTYLFLNSCGITDAATAREVFLAIVEDPANYLKYYVGYLEFDALKERARAALGSNFRLYDFHEYLLSLGPAPFSLLEKKIDEFIANQD